jgi:ATP-binding cassette subfamily B protein
VAIARALLADPRILILDDATSSVDATTEGAIKSGLREVMEGRTTFIIAHRLSTVSLADEVIVMDGGHIVDRGTHAELLEGCSFYREIAEHGLADSVFLQHDLEQREVACAASCCSSARSGSCCAARISAPARCAGCWGCCGPTAARWH